MATFSSEFDNERGEPVAVTVKYTQESVTISISRPETTEMMILTRMEMAAIRMLMNPHHVEPIYKRPE